jgi:flagellar hook-associated protein 3 FlgL
MRVTANMSAENSVYNIQLGRARLDKLQESISSGQNVNRPSDDPISSRLLMEIGDKLKNIDQYSSNIDKSTSWLKFTSTALQGISGVVSQAKKLAGTISSTTDPIFLQSAHNQFIDLKKQVIDMANMQYGDQYIFGGANNTVPPFNTTNNNYAGDSTELLIEIGQNATQTLNVTGDRLLLGGGTDSKYGTTDILAAFDTLINATAVGGSVAAIPGAAIELENGAKQLINATSDILSRTTRLDNMGKLNDNNKNTLLSISTSVQEVDYAKLGVQLNQQKTAFDASLSATAKLSQLSLLDYL